MLFLQLYKKDNPGFFPYLVILFIVIFIAGHFLFQNRMADMLLILGMVLILFLINFVEKRPEPIGEAVFSYNMIRLTTKHENLEFKLNEPVCVKINYGGYRDQPMVGDFIPMYNKYSGIDNAMIIRMEEHLYEFKFLVKDKNHEESLLDVIGSWKLQGFNIHYNE